MIDINLIRNDIDFVKRHLAGRSDLAMVDLLYSFDIIVRKLQTEKQELEASRNELSKKIGLAVRMKQMVDVLQNEAKAVNAKLKIIEEKLADNIDARDRIWHKIANLADTSVPIGGEENNQIIFQDEIPEFNFEPKEHFDLPGFDFETAAKLAGTRFTTMNGTLAKLHRVIGQFMIDFHTEHFGFNEVDVPLLVNEKTMFGTGQLPKFEEDLFKTTDGRYLIPTAEVSLTNTVANTIIDYGDLPIRMVALTPCFRAEAGSAGRDTRGLIRQHQFNKVELVTIAEPATSEREHEYMLNAAETILKELELPFRRVLLAAGDMGFSARKTYDLEVWLPGQKAWREISSISNCGDFQARRMGARVKLPGDKNTTFVHTLNGSGLAVGRTLVAILENYQEPDGTVVIPKVLQPYFKNRIIL